MKITFLSLSAIGNCLLSLPLLLETRRRYPDADVTLLCMRPAVMSLAIEMGIADKVVLLPREARRSLPAFSESLRLAAEAQAELTLQSFASHGTFGNLIAGATRAPIRCGFADGRFQDRLTHRIPIDPNKHLIQLNLDLLRRLGFADVEVPQGRTLPVIENQVSRSDAKPADRYGRYVVISTGSDPKLAFKRWPAEKWVTLCERLESDGLKSIFVGDASQHQQAQQIISAAGLLGINLCGETTFADLAALVSDSQMLIATDGMLLHLAAALDKACVGIFGPTHPAIGGAFGEKHRAAYLELPCSPCYGSSTVGKGAGCSSRECLTHLSADLVYQRCQELAASRREMG